MKHILFLVLLFSTIVSSQNPQELIKTTKVQYNSAKSHTDKAKLSADLSWYYAQVNIDSAQFYGLKSLELATKVKDNKLIAQSMNDLATVFFIKGDYLTSLDYTNKSLKIRKKIKDDAGVASLYFKKGNAFNKMAQYDSTMHYYFKANKYYEKVGDTAVFMNLESNISSTYFSMGNYGKALQYLKKPLAYFESTKQLYVLSNSTLNLGNIQLSLKDTIKAMESYSKSISYANQSNNFSTLASAYNNMANVFIAQNKFNLAVEYITKSIKIREEHGLDVDLESSMLTLANSELKIGNFIDSKKHFLRVKKVFEKNKVNEKIKEVYLGLSFVYAAEKNTDSLNYFYQKYTEVSNAFYKGETLKASQEIEVKYQTEKKEKLLAEAKVELLAKEAKIKKRTTFLISALALAFLFGLIGFLVYKQQRLKNEQIIKENELRQALIKIENQNNLQEQRLAISKDLHDNIGSQLTFIISSLDNLKYFEFTKDKLYSKFDSIGTFTRSTITDLRDTIWAMNKEVITFEDLKSRTTNFIEAAKTSLLGITFEFNYPEDTSEVTLNSLQGIDVYRIIQEAVNNAVKHANANKIAVDFLLIKNTLEVSITDNGKGFDKELIEAGNGLNSMKKRAQEINADFSIEPLNQGTKVKLKFNLENNTQL